MGIDVKIANHLEAQGLVSVANAIKFRTMQERDRRQVRALLGDLPLRAADCIPLVAVMPGSPVILGASIIASTPIHSRPHSAPFTMAVAQPFRRRGVGRRLLAASSAFCRNELKVPALCSWFGIERGSPEAALWENLGFAARARLAHYNADIRPYLDLLTLTVSRLRQRNRIPAGAVVMPLHEAPIGAVLELHLRHLGGNSARLEPRLRGFGIRPYHPLLSQVAIHQGNVCGFVLARINHEEKLVLDARVIAPQARRSWVNPRLLEAAGQHAERLGLTTMRFMGNTQHTDTHRLANRFGPSFVRVMDFMLRRGTASDSGTGNLAEQRQGLLQGDNFNATEKTPALVSGTPREPATHDPRRRHTHRARYHPAGLGADSIRLAGNHPRYC